MSRLKNQVQKASGANALSWNTIYIKGKPGFKKALLGRLDESWPYGNPDSQHKLLMFWLSDETSLREFKMAIGSKIVFKYRLKFFASVDEFIESDVTKENDGRFSSEEQSMVHEMAMRENSQKKALAKKTLVRPG